MEARARKQILVVDDEHDVQEVIAEVLADEDYSAVAAGNGQEALDQLHAMAEKPCAILLDLRMPVMNGFEFRAVQQSDPALQRIPVIIVTANFQAAEVADLDIAGFVRKPFEPEALLETINAACCGLHAPIDAGWQRVTRDPERWQRIGFGAIEPRGPLLWAALPTCGHDYHSAATLIEAQRQLEEHAGLCFVCWYRTHAFRKALRGGQSTPPDGSDLD